MLAGLPARRPLPGRGDRPARTARPRAAPRGARRGRRRCTSGRARPRSARRASRRRRRRLRAPEIVVATNAWTTGWRPGARPADELRQLRRPHRAGPGAARGDRLDGRRGDRRRPDVHPLLPHDRRRARGDGLRLGADRPRRPVDDRFFDDAATAARAEQGLRRLLPGLAAARVERAWGGPIDVSSDQLPFFGTVPGTRIHFGAGYSGNGVGPSWLGGQILASLVLGADDEWSRLPLANRLPPRLPPEPIRYVGGAAVRRAILAVEAPTRRAAAPWPLARGVAALPRVLGLRIGTR